MERQQVRMYAVQAAAYEARQEYEPYVTKVPSTPETPPVVESDLTKACEAKKLALVNKPQVCSHCEAPLQTEYFEEFNGTIFAYCKSTGGCGKSQVLFVNPELLFVNLELRLYLPNVVFLNNPTQMMCLIDKLC